MPNEPPRTADPAGDRSRPIRLGLLVALATAPAFLPILINGWVERDDPQNFLDNVGFRGIGLAQVRWAFTTVQLGVYQPLGWLILGAEYRIWGLIPWGYHLVSLALHLANAAILVVLIAAILGRCPGRVAGRAGHVAAAWAGLLFAIHPLRVEVVAWASSQTYLPCAGFAMLSVLAYLGRDRASRGGRAGRLALSWCLYVAALLCKAPALPLPLALLILDAFPLRRLSGRASARAAVLEKLPFGLVTLVFVGLARAGKAATSSSLTAEAGLGWGGRLARAACSAGFYVRQTAWPAGLAAVYEWPDPAPAVEPARLVAVGAVLAASATCLALAARRPGLAATWFAYLAMLAPVAGLVRSGYAIVADRYSYLATVPFAIGLAYLLASARPGRAGARALTAGLVVAALAMATITWQLCQSWHDQEALVERAWRAGTLSRASYLIQVADFQGRRHQPAEAEANYREAVRLAPERADAANALGAFLARRRRTEEALACFERALALDGRHVPALNNIGLALAGRGRFGEAIPRFRAALRIEPSYVDARLNLAATLRDLGRPADAAEEYAQVLRIDPAEPRARAGLDSLALEANRGPGRPSSPPK